MSQTRVESEASERASPSFWDEKPLLQKIISIAPNILYVFNHQTQTNEFINSSLGASMGYSADEIAGMGADFLPMICHPEDLPRLQKNFETFQSLSDGEVAQIEYRMKHKDGHWRWMLSNDTVFDRDDAGDVMRLIGVATDITTRKEAEESALAQKRSADAANEELRDFAYSVSHDLKAPANTLHLLLSELLDQHETQLEGDARDLVDLSMDMVHKMQNLVEDVLGYTRIIGSEAMFEDVVLGDLVQDVIKGLAGDIQQANATLLVEDLPTVRASAVQMRVYFQNVIGNALKYKCEDRDLVIKVRDTTDPNDARVCVSVTDNGIGVAPENHDRIFGMFKRLHLEDEIAGTGLGLALCQRVALNHGGGIKVDSALGAGSTFTIDLESV